MTAQAQLTEPPTPKTTTKAAKVHTISKTRQKKFVRHFPQAEDEKVLNRKTNTYILYCLKKYKFFLFKIILALSLVTSYCRAIYT